MTSEFFDKIVKERMEKTVNVLTIKGKEYRRNNNPMHNFEVAARFTGAPREIPMWGFATKHLVSFMDILEDIKQGKLPTEAVVDEKIGDLINYLILVEASIKDKIIETNNNTP